MLDNNMMIIQIANIGAGFVLAAPKVKEYVGKHEIERFLRVIAPYQNHVGLIELGIGIIALMTRAGITNFHISDFGASYPQAIPAILMGAVIATGFFDRYPKAKEYINKLEPYRTELGFLGIAVGVGSLMFGCVLPLVCGQMFR